MALTDRVETETHVITAALAAAVAARAPEHRRADVGAFARAYLRRRGDEDVDEVAPEVLAAFSLLAGRGTAPSAVRAFTPTRAEHGYERSGSVLETNTDDLPFLVDSITAALEARRLKPVAVHHPILGTDRAPDGTLRRVAHPGEAPRRESLMHFELSRRLDAATLAELEDAAREVLAQVRVVVEDFPAMQAATERVAADIEDPEDEAFLRWLLEGTFVFLGFREDAAGEALGLLRDERLREEDAPDGGLVIAKTSALSPVHRRRRMDEISVARRGGGRAQLVGLFTTRAYGVPAEEVPLLRRKLQHVLAGEDLVPGSHDWKAAVALFESFPRDELFAAPAEELRRAVVKLLDLRGDAVKLLVRPSEDGRTVAAVLAVPRERHDATLVARVERLLLDRFGGTDADAHEVLGDDFAHARVHFAVHAPGGTRQGVDPAELQRAAAELARSWDDGTREQLRRHLGDERGEVLAARWLPRLPSSYKAAVAPSGAAHDVQALEALHTRGGRLALALRNEHGEAGALTRVVLVTAGAKAQLSTVTPLLEDLGLRVVEERPSRLEGGSETWIQDYGVLGPAGAPLDLEADGDRVTDVLAAAMRGEAESDSLHRLVILAGLDRAQIGVLRAYRKYRQRIGSRFTEGYQNDVIAANAPVTAKLMRLFALRFDPATPFDPAACAALREEILQDLEAVTSLDEDRILRNQLGLIEATVRTNAYRPGRGALAFKLRSAEVPAIPLPAPLFEIFVHDRDVEGIHLRGGRIARGGIRWSDRMDYRTEVFGLMRAQMTKNAVIVPDGAKGGFYLRRRPADAAALKAAVGRQYVAYISALLDVTDDLVEGQAVHPDGVRVHDEDDPYLVVAADKGTATFSDTANAIALERGFWLGDAFASGGSKGYDHKALGITARGAWESLKRHFRELGRDPAVETFTAVGIGDMSGDVFGNGMLLSDRIKLVAAYDHRHVFLDPDPDPAAQFAERRRLFELAGSSWDDFDRGVLSEGGGVFPRTAKRIALTPQVRAALGVEDAQLPPNEVIRAILRAPVDVLWNGGIGTVVKASAETDDDALDRSSDAIRVDARDLRCRIVAEGGNLGLTQRARIEFSRRGGLVNADFIDNSAGVDCSDHEVNLKVLLALAVRRGELHEAGRDALLAEVTEDVAAHVLHDSFLQAQILAQEVRTSAGRMLAYEDLIATLESTAPPLVDRAVDHLPGREELAERRRDGRGMERPELAVLLANAKRALTGAVLRSALPDDDALAFRVLRDYFPLAIVERFEHLLLEHPLRRELVATKLANGVVDSLGPTWAAQLQAELGCDPALVVRAFRVAQEATDASERWERVEALGRQVEPELFWTLMERVALLVQAVARWELREGDPTVPAPERGAALQAGLRAALPVLPRIGDPDWVQEREAQVAALAGQGVPEAVARPHVYADALAHAPSVGAVAVATGRDVEAVGRTFMLLGARLRLAWLETQVAALRVPTRMARWAAQALRDDVLRAWRDFAHQALAEAPGASPEEAVETFLAARAARLERLRTFSAALDTEGPDLPGLSLAVRHLRDLA